jgi:hypothetical protein
LNPMLFANAQIHRFLALARAVFSEGFFVGTERALLLLSGYAAPVAALLGLGVGIYGAVKTDSLSFLMMGLGWVLAVWVGYFVGYTMLGSCERALVNNRSTVSSRDYLDVLSLLGLLTSLCALGAGVFMAIKFDTHQFLWWSMGIATATLYLACLYMHPALLTTRVDPHSSAGEDAISLSVLTIKGALRLAPLVFSVLTVAGTAGLAWGGYGLWQQEDTEIVMGSLASMSGLMMLVVGLMYPLAIYLTFVFSYLMLDVLRAVLRLPVVLAGNAAQDTRLQEREGAPDVTAPAVVPAMSPSALKWVLGSLALVVALSVAGMQGKKMYTEYQAEQEAQRVAAEEKAERERMAAETLRLQAEAQKAEEQRKARFRDQVLTAKDKPALELLFVPEVSAALREKLGSATHAGLERFFVTGEPVRVEPDAVVAQGCMPDECGTNEGLVVVDLLTGKVHAAVFNGQVRYLTSSASEAHPILRRWALKFPQ